MKRDDDYAELEDEHERDEWQPRGPVTDKSEAKDWLDRLREQLMEKIEQ